MEREKYRKNWKQNSIFITMHDIKYLFQKVKSPFSKISEKRPSLFWTRLM